MAAFTFEKAARRKVAPKLAIQGVSGAGKTYSALRFARGYVGQNGRIAFIDTENGSASLYADLTPFDVLNVAPRSFGEGKQAVTAFWWTIPAIRHLKWQARMWNGWNLPSREKG